MLPPCLCGCGSRSFRVPMTCSPACDWWPIWIAEIDSWPLHEWTEVKRLDGCKTSLNKSSASLLNKAKHVSLALTNRTSAYTVYCRTMVSLHWVVNWILNSSMVLFNVERIAHSCYQFFRKKSSCLGLKSLKGCFMCHDGQNSVSLNCHHRKQLQIQWKK